MNQFIQKKIFERLKHSYNPDLNNKKILLLVATHTNTELKLNTIKKNLQYFRCSSINILVCNSTNLPFNSELSSYYNNNNISYYEIENDNKYDFGKWIYLLRNINYTLYDFVIFTNDSYIIHYPITQFINLTIKNNYELYGYNDSTQYKYHYQSYLFSIRNDAINKFIGYYRTVKDNLNSQEDVINMLEIKMIHFFKTKGCFLNIGLIKINRGKNVFFTNDFLYNKLKSTRLLPFTKIKRIL